MATRTKMTSIITSPANVRWKCSKCGTRNASTGNFRFKEAETVFGSPNSQGVKRDHELLTNRLMTSWRMQALRIVLDPLNNANELRDNLYVANPSCKKCKNREIWTEDRWYAPFLAWLVIAEIITALFGLFVGPEAWLFFAVFTIVLVYIFYDTYSFEGKLRKLPSESIPKIESTDELLSSYISRYSTRKNKATQSLNTKAVEENHNRPAPNKSDKEQHISNQQPERAEHTINNGFSAADEIEKFKGLLDKGIITQEEFDAKKKQLLGL